MRDFAIFVFLWSGDEWRRRCRRMKPKDLHTARCDFRQRRLASDGSNGCAGEGRENAWQAQNSWAFGGSGRRRRTRPNSLHSE